MKLKLMVAMLATCLAGAANSETITFSDFEHGDLIANGQFDFGGITGTITTTNFGDGPDTAQIFDTGFDGKTSDPDLQNPTETTTGDVYTGSNILIISENGDSSDPDDEAGGGTVVLVFDELIEFLGITLLDSETRYNNEIDVQVDGGVYALEDITTGNHHYQEFTGFSYVTQSITVTLGGSGGFDNIQIAPVPVPVPASAALLLGGLGGLAAMRRRKAKQAA